MSAIHECESITRNNNQQQQQRGGVANLVEDVTTRNNGTSSCFAFHLSTTSLTTEAPSLKFCYSLQFRVCQEPGAGVASVFACAHTWPPPTVALVTGDAQTQLQLGCLIRSNYYVKYVVKHKSAKLLMTYAVGKLEAALKISHLILSTSSQS